jgi:homoserine O-acetyltransferase/O-succinyltransferase
MTVLLLQGTAGSAADFVQAAYFDALYGAGEPLDLSRYFLVIPDAIGAEDWRRPAPGTWACRRGCRIDGLVQTGVDAEPIFPPCALLAAESAAERE